MRSSLGARFGLESGFENQIEVKNWVALVLCALALALPTAEAPKNILLALLVLAWIRLIWTKRYNQSTIFTHLLGWSLALLVVSSIVSTALNFSWPLAGKTVKYSVLQGILFWLALTSVRSEKDRTLILWSISVGASLALGWALLFADIPQDHNLHLPSAGSVNRSAAYLGIAFFCSVGLGLARRGLHRCTSLLAFAMGVFQGMGLWLMGSRGVVFAVIASIMIVAVAAKSFRLVLTGVAVLLVTSLVAFFVPNKHAHHRIYSKSAALLSFNFGASEVHRLAIWRLAIEKIRTGEDLLFGTGPRSFRELQPRKFGVAPPQGPGIITPHAHNIFLNQLIEFGTFGLATFLYFIALVTRLLYREAKVGRAMRPLWIAGIGALAVPLVAGMFNHTWVEEHGLLSMLVLGLLAGETTNGRTSELPAQA